MPNHDRDASKSPSQKKKTMQKLGRLIRLGGDSNCLDLVTILASSAFALQFNWFSFRRSLAGDFLVLASKPIR